MDGWDSEQMRPLAIAAALAVAGLLATRARARWRDNEEQLRPTVFSYLFLILLVVLFSGLAHLGWGETRLDQIRWWYAILIGILLGGGCWYWYFHACVIFWTDQGVGLRGPFLSPKFIRWSEVTWAGRLWSGDQQIRSKDCKISFSTFHGGFLDLVAATKRHVPTAFVHF